MDNNESQSRSELILQNGKSVLIGTDWTNENKYSGLVLSLILRNKAAKDNLHYCASNFVTVNEKITTQYSFADLSDIDDGTKFIAGEISIAKNINRWVSITGEDATEETAEETTEEATEEKTVFIKSLPASDILSEDRFWVTVVDSEGLISLGIESVVANRRALKDALDVIGFTEPKLRFVFVDSDGPVRSFISEIRSGVNFEISSTHEISEESYFKSFNDEQTQYKRIYKPSKVKIEKVGVLAAVLCVSAASWFGFSYLSQKEAMDYFSNEQTISILNEERSSYSKTMKSLKSSDKSWDPQSYRDTTLEQFVADLDDNMYSAMDIALVLREINRTLPIYAAEWELSKLTYQANKFYARYERIKGGKGVYFLLDDVIAKLDSVKTELKISPLNLIDEGRTRTFQIIPVMDLPKKANLLFMQEKMRKETKIKQNIAKRAKRASDKTGNLLALFDKYNALDFQSKWIKRESIDIYENVALINTEIESAKFSLNEANRQNDSFQALELKPELILGNVMDFVTMMQLDSFFKWSYPEMKKSYPSQKSLADRNKKAKKKSKKSKDNSAVYGVAIESHFVKITSQENEDEGKTKSYGISDMIQLGLLINKPFVNVDLVEYDKESEQWGFNIHFHRQTSEYTQRIAQFENKDVK